MIEKLKYFPVHWIDGMKINKGHFTDIQNFISDSVRDSIGVHTSPVDYGLLPVNDAVKVSTSVDQHKLLKVVLEECQAITPNGSRIDISTHDTGFSEYALLSPDSNYVIKDEEDINLMVCISVNHFNRVPFGELDPDENPPRYPYTKPKYSLELIAESELRNTLGFRSGYLMVARIIISAGECTIDEDYIPPCVSVSSHTKLKKLYVEIDRFYCQVELFASQIKQKIRAKKQNNLLSLLVDDIAEKVVCYLGSEINRYRWSAPYSPPVYMLSSVITLGRILKNCLETYTGCGKEELLNYLTEWCNISQGDFESIFSEVLNAEYNHNQIGSVVLKIERFIKTAEEIFSILNQLDYIGKKRDGSIFISENQNDRDAIIHSKRSHSFLAD
ncbi:Type VI secretion, VC_A0110, EvfL, ImpJ, VasE [Chryseobacterium rhizoplanae]|uniref:Type VI secretion, VC_A0110, EvfL, ImpJ, VasE n=1 Tax=Chryseobacterium rhizoplanae TaxID=1609531 RepID=A0A521DM35_9FLAO|nr:type VI secretion system baseplate subunit TssK [Chryseobacterium rhizoplanae]SMO72665.1 Type VI secretion, VC_A0110, EvfL, ImpJ, VasE [Chryseobacterium rhizoplanae]